VQSSTTVRATQLHRGSVRIGWILLLVFLLLLLISLPVRSDKSPGNPAAGQPDDLIEEIVVTGTRIKRRDFQTASPLTTVNRQDIEFTGQMTLEETLNQMPQVLPQIGRTGNNPSLGSNPGIGGAEVDLRGLGPTRTLVLLNGRRVAPSGTDNRVDLNTIPQQLVDRIEIITGGTSAVYGSDALAGVVNFITKDDYSGLGIEAGASLSEQGDAETYDIEISYGHNFRAGRGNITGYATYLERKSLLAGEREFTRIAWLDNWETGELVEGGSPVVPEGLIVAPLADLGGGPGWVIFEPDGTPREALLPEDFYNYAPANYLQIPLTRTAAGIMGHYEFSESVEGYAELGFARNEPGQRLAPLPAFMSAEINLDNPFLTPEAQQVFADNYACDVNLACVFLFKRLIELGPRFTEHERDHTRVIAGLRGDLRAGWEFDTWLGYTQASSTVLKGGDASRSRFLQGLLVDPVSNECLDPTGVCAPLNIFGEGNLSSEGVAFIRFDAYEDVTESTHKIASVVVTGSPADTWAGPLDTAFGLEWRSDEVYFKADDALSGGDSLNFVGHQSTIDGGEEVLEIYAEAVIPLATDTRWARSLALEVGGRYSDYELAGGVSTYKAGGEWQPVDGLRLRAMRQRSSRAPNSGELFEEQRENEGFYIGATNADPCSASEDPVGNGNAEKCLIQGLPEDQIGVFEATPFYPTTFISGGNPGLEPETGDTWTIGAVIAPPPLPGWTVTVDYFSFEITDTIGSIDPNLICFDPQNTSRLFCDELSRDATGNVSEVRALTSNRGLLETTGIDTQLQYVADLPEALALGSSGADISVNVYWTHMLTNKEQENPATEILDCAGYFGWPCDTDARTAVYPENRVTSNIHYRSGSFETHLTWRWIDGTDNAALLESAVRGEPAANTAVPSVGSKHYLDLGFGYTFGDALAARFGITNLLETDPPMMADAVWGPNTATGLYDVFGRSYYLTLSAQF
jgi:outer membrane receptor protein involved in Fe transport